LVRLSIVSRTASLIAAASALLMLSGCGYKPVYGEQSAAVSGDGARANLASVKILGVADRRGQLLRNYLLDRMTPRGEPAQPRYILSITSNEARRITDSRADGTATRADLIIAARYNLRDATTDLVVFSERSQGLATYNLLTARYASVASEDEARRRAVEQVADEIALQVALFLNRRHAAGQADKAQ
jgi:LPS-assembly lipoprotein